MKTNGRKGLACAVCCALLLAGCAGKSTRTILIEAPKSGGTQAEQTGTAGDIREIHSIKQLATLDEMSIELTGQGWMGEARLCAVARYQMQTDGAFLVSVDDTYGFVKKLEGTEGDGWYTLSPDGKNVAYATQSLSEADKEQLVMEDAGKFIPPAGYQSIYLYQTERAEVTRVYRNREGYSLSVDTYRFSSDGRYVSFLEYRWDGSEKFVHIYDLYTDTLNTYNAYVDDVMINPRWVDVDNQGRPAYVLGYSKGKGTCYVRLIADETYKQTYPDEILVSNINFEQYYANLGDDIVFLNQYNELVCKHLATGKSQMLQRNVLSMVVSQSGKRVAYTKASGNNMELYVADLVEGQGQGPGIAMANARVVYTGMNLSLIQWSPAGDKLLILDPDKEESRSSYRVLEFYTAE